MAKLSETTTTLFGAIHKFQSEVGKIAKDADNPFFKSRYATLNQVWEGIQPILAKNKLAVIQLPDEDGLTTIIAHVNGEFISTTASMPNIPDAQKHGGYITYMRRYALAGLGLVIDGDDDANELVKGQKAAAKKEPARSLVTKGTKKWGNKN
jgi:hypothetical protein